MKKFLLLFMITFAFAKLNNVVIDYNTGLMWQDDKEIITTVSKYGKVTSRMRYLNWYEAKKYCENLKLDGFEDWRLPTVYELVSIMNFYIPKGRSAYNHTKSMFKHMHNEGYWSADSDINGRTRAWYVNFAFGSIYTHTKDRNRNYVKCVRGGNDLMFDSYTNLRVYAAAKFAEGENLENRYFFVKNLYGKLDDLLYTKYPFKEIARLTNKVLNIYVDIPEIPKPKLPPMPKLVKSQFETKKMFQERVNREIAKREEIIKKLQQEYRKKVEARNAKILYIQKHLPQKIKEFQKGALKTVMGTFYFTDPKYDAETQTMYVTLKSSRSSYKKRVALNVPIYVAKNFYNNISNIKADVRFLFDKNKIILNSINAIYKRKVYMAKLTDKDFKPQRVEVVLKDKKVDFKSAKPLRLSLQNPNLKDTYQIDGIIYQDGKKISGKKFNDDIPVLLAHTKQAPVSNKKWLFVIGISKYDQADNIAFASRSAKLFTKVMQKKLGISKRHTYLLLDNKATTARILNNLQIMLSEVKPGDTIYFYYNGHGIPDPKKGNAPFILPSDQIPDFVVQNDKLMLQNIYNKLSSSRAGKVIAFIDSCFSGATDGKSVIKGVAATRLVPKQVTFDRKKMVVITAGRKTQYSNMYPAKGERLFTYYVMKSILKGRKDIKTLYNEVYVKVKDTSNSFGPLKVQEPTISGNENLKL
jgi:hypothetical protein